MFIVRILANILSSDFVYSPILILLLGSKVVWHKLWPVHYVSSALLCNVCPDRITVVFMLKIKLKKFPSSRTPLNPLKDPWWFPSTCDMFNTDEGYLIVFIPWNNIFIKFNSGSRDQRFSSMFFVSWIQTCAFPFDEILCDQINSDELMRRLFNISWYRHRQMVIDGVCELCHSSNLPLVCF